ncbi:MAG: tRNA guanosine(34) transglycosylase Tgt [Pirellulales bacterium]
MARCFPFHVEAIDLAGTARAGRFCTPHGDVLTPAFMPVGTQATVKGLTPAQLADAGAQIVLANTYHLALRPGADVVARLGGLHRFMGWDGPILTDSGGFQVYSLATLCRIDDTGVQFRSHVDGSLLELTPERAVELQQQLGADCIMCLDQCPPYGSSPQQLAEAVDRTIAWAGRCRDAHRRPDQALLAIVQGGWDPALRARCARGLVAMDFAGYAVGGLSVGEQPHEMYPIVEATAACLPDERPRYLMGVGRPEDLLESVARGMDLFDCVLPTRNGRNAMAFTSEGRLRLRNRQFETDERPVDPRCACPVCRHFSRAYLRHLFQCGEMLGPILLSWHNVAYYQSLVRDARDAIGRKQFSAWKAATLAALGPGDDAAEAGD